MKADVFRQRRAMRITQAAALSEPTSYSARLSQA
jgi:hypothetical protein